MVGMMLQLAFLNITAETNKNICVYLPLKSIGRYAIRLVMLPYHIKNQSIIKS